MPQINWPRLIVGGIIASIICFLTDGFFHEKVLTSDWMTVYNGLGIHEVKHQAIGLLYFVVFDLGRGFLPILLYVLMRPFCRPGPKTALLAAIVAWLFLSVTGPAQFIPLQFYSNTLWIKVAGFQLITSIIATIAGAALYKDSAQN